MSDHARLLARKIAVTFAIGAGVATITLARPVIDGIEHQDWPTVWDAGRILVYGALAGGLRALIALLTAFLPTDADTGINLAGRYRK